MVMSSCRASVTLLGWAEAWKTHHSCHLIVLLKVNVILRPTLPLLLLLLLVGLRLLLLRNKQKAGNISIANLEDTTQSIITCCPGGSVSPPSSPPPAAPSCAPQNRTPSASPPSSSCSPQNVSSPDPEMSALLASTSPGSSDLLTHTHTHTHSVTHTLTRIIT